MCGVTGSWGCAVFEPKTRVPRRMTAEQATETTVTVCGDASDTPRRRVLRTRPVND